MKSFLRDWTTNILIISIFISLLEIILPKSNMKRYIEMIIGLLIIIVIINPFIKLLNGNIDIEREVFASITKSNNINYYDNNDLKEIQEKQIIEIYKRKLIEDVKSLIEKDGNYLVKQIVLDIETVDENNYGKINKISINIEKGNNNENKKEKVKKIEIKVDAVQSNKELTSQKDKYTVDIQSITKSLYDKFNIQHEDISIYFD